MTLYGLDEIIGHDGESKSKGFAGNQGQFSPNFLRKIGYFSGEKPVEISLKTLHESAY
jgi:hypothetical protein